MGICSIHRYSSRDDDGGRSSTIAPFVSYDTVMAVLYVWLQKAFYGCIKSALLFYEKLLGDLKAYGFSINPYDP